MKLSPLSALLCNERAKLVIAKARIPVIARTICVLFRLFSWQHDWHTSSLSSLECFVVLFWDYSNILLVWCYSVFSWILIWCVLTWYLFWCTLNLCYLAGLEKLRGQIATQISLLLFWLAVRRGHLCDKRYRNLLFGPCMPLYLTLLPIVFYTGPFWIQGHCTELHIVHWFVINAMDRLASGWPPEL